jgi:arsenate reductase-like glutaredoxin family protein
MVEAEVALFASPDCASCRAVAAWLTARGVAFRWMDVTAGEEAFRLLLRYAGAPIVPTVVAYGQVMVGFDEARLAQMLDGLQARADAFARAEDEEEEHLRRSEIAAREGLEEVDREVEAERRVQAERHPEEHRDAPDPSAGS